MTADRWVHVVRQTQEQLRLGRLLPLGGARDGAWLAESAAVAALRRMADGLTGVRLGTLRIAGAEGATGESAVPAPPSALPPGPLRAVAECAVSGAEPIPASAARLRKALAEAATVSLGLSVTEVDLRVTALFEENAPSGPLGEAGPSTGPEPAGSSPEPDAPASPASPPGAGGPAAVGRPGSDEARAAAAARAVSGVARLAGVLAGAGRAVHIEERTAPDGRSTLPRRHVRVEIEVARDHRPLDVARAVRAAVSAALPDSPSTAVLVTSLD